MQFFALAIHVVKLSTLDPSALYRPQRCSQSDEFPLQSQPKLIRALQVRHTPPKLGQKDSLPTLA